MQVLGNVFLILFSFSPGHFSDVNSSNQGTFLHWSERALGLALSSYFVNHSDTFG